MFKNIARNKATFAVVLVIILALSYIAMFGIQFSEDSRLRGASDMRTGIDIRGGVDAKFVPKDLDHKATAEELESARNIIEARLDEKKYSGPRRHGRQRRRQCHGPLPLEVRR